MGIVFSLPAELRLSRKSRQLWRRLVRLHEGAAGAILRKMSDDDMAEYRRPFAEPGEGRRPTLTWPREIPIEGDPADVTAIVTA